MNLDKVFGKSALKVFKIFKSLSKPCTLVKTTSAGYDMATATESIATVEVAVRAILTRGKRGTPFSTAYDRTALLLTAETGSINGFDTLVCQGIRWRILPEVRCDEYITELHLVSENANGQV